MEKVDVVDESGNVLYQTTKEDAHQKGLLHPCVLCELKDSQGNWILIKQSASKQDAGQWISPVGGHITSGESTEDALRREVNEEVGINQFTSNFIGKLIFNRFVLNRQENHLIYVYELLSDDPISLNDESESYKRFSTGELKQEVKRDHHQFGDAFYEVFKTFYPEILS